MGRPIDCKKFSDDLLSLIAKSIQTKQAHPILSVLTIGEVSAASQAYIRNKQKACERVGIIYQHIAFSSTENVSTIINIIKQLNDNPQVGGIIVQLPIQHEVLNANPDGVKVITSQIDPSKDVDGFSFNAGGFLYEGFKKHPYRLYPCTACGVYRLLLGAFDGLEGLKGKNVTIVGRSDLVGKPLALMLQDADCTVTVCHSKTKNLNDHLKNADILISATGVPGLLENLPTTYEAIIDVGITRGEDGKLHGDISEEIKRKHSEMYTSVPGGIGLVTVTMLISNVWLAYQENNFAENN